MKPLLTAQDLCVRYSRGGRVVNALSGVSLEIFPGECLGVAGESGCGKSTLGRALIGLRPLAAGRVFLGDVDISALSRRKMRSHRRRAQMVFQDSLAALDPRMTLARSVAEPLEAAGAARAEARGIVASLLAEVGLTCDMGERYPHEVSGGQRQRAAIARALAPHPELVILDEPVSALDAAVRAQILGLLSRLRRSRGLSMMLISHDISALRALADRLLVMYMGRVVESGPARDVLSRPLHPYARMLLDAVLEPDPDKARARLQATAAPGESGSESPESGCPFAPRCPLVEARCRDAAPALTERTEGRHAACHRAGT